MTSTVESEPIEHDPDRPSPSPDAFCRVLWFAAGIVVLLLIRGFVVEPVRVSSDSMEPSLRSGSMVLIDKVTFDFREPRRGDVVVTSDPISVDSRTFGAIAIDGRVAAPIWPPCWPCCVVERRGPD